MLENRSFDHMLGFLYAAEGNVPPSGATFDGLTGKESNPDQNGNLVLVSQATSSRPSLYFLPGADPGEGYVATNSQLFGAAGPSAQPTNAGFVTNYSSTLAWESRDPGWSVLPGTVAAEIMVMFTPETLPVLSALARGFAVCDQWFSSVPTETLPNRAFACCATSQGHMDDKAKTFTSPSIFGLLSNKGTSWTIYGYDSPPLTRQLLSEITEADEAHFGLFTDFQARSLQFPRAQLGIDWQQPAPQLRRCSGRTAPPRRLLRPPQRARLGEHAARDHLRRARRLLRPCPSAGRGCSPRCQLG
jgi:phospholipase C